MDPPDPDLRMAGTEIRAHPIRQILPVLRLQFPEGDPGLLMSGDRTVPLEDRDAVAQLRHQLGGKLLGLPGDDLELHGGLAALQDGVADAGAEVAVDEAQDHRLELIPVDKEGQHRHGGVEAEDQPDQTGLRPLFPHPGGHDVRAPGRAVPPDDPAVHRAADDARGHRSQDSGGAGVVGDAAEIHLSQNQRHGGEHQHKGQGLAGEVRVHLLPGQQDQRQVDQQGEVADVDVQQILQHGGQAVDARRRKGVGKDEQLIADAHQTGQGRHGGVAAKGVPDAVFHGKDASVKY